ncbi:MAG TPA: nitronate monooxygenase, partial [Mycobacterium sp.]|nr:nitronate monooxygenase [Mycobacterium sp.]
QVGTALLLSDEAGTNAVHRAALHHAQSASTDSPGKAVNTIVTRAFSGRYARCLVNDFTDRFDAVAPPGYPEVNQMTSPIRKAAVGAGDPNGTSLWAGIAHREIRGGPAADIVAALAG